MITCPTNELYGHADVYRRYVGIGVDVLINGRLQHGWSVDKMGVMAGDSLHLRGGKFFVWSKKFSIYGRKFRTAVELPQDKVYVVGAPILYLDRPSVVSKGTLAIPSHSVRDRKVPEASWRKYCAAIRDYDKTAAVLVHRRDIELGYHKVVEDYELTPITAGLDRSLSFIVNIVTILSSFEVIISNCIQTACFYALYLGKFVKIHGSETKKDPEDVGDNLVFDVDYISKHYPLLLKGTSDPQVATEELGTLSDKNYLKKVMFT